MNKVIFFEGSNYAGKSTAIRNLKERLEKEGKSVATYKDPGTGLIADDIREILTNKEYNHMTYRCRRLLHAASHVELLKIIKDTIDDWDYILVDRYNPMSDTIYGPMLSGKEEDFIHAKNTCAMYDNDFLVGKASLIYFDIDEETLIERIEKRGTAENKVNDYQGIEFKLQILSNYVDFMSNIQSYEYVFPFKEVYVVAATETEEEIADKIYKGVKNEGNSN